MIRILAEQRTVYRSEIGRRGRLRKRAAYLDAAWQAWKAAHPCECLLDQATGIRIAQCLEHADEVVYEDGYPHIEPSAERAKHRRAVIDRLARWLMWRDSRPVERAPDAPPLFKVGEPVSFLHRDRVVFGVITAVRRAHVGHVVSVAEGITKYEDQRLWMVMSWAVPEGDLTRLVAEKGNGK